MSEVPGMNPTTVRVVLHCGTPSTAEVVSVAEDGALLKIMLADGVSTVTIKVAPDGVYGHTELHVMEDDLHKICAHQWTGERVYVPGLPDEWIEYCQKCGMENPGSWVEGES